MIQMKPIQKYKEDHE